MTDFTGIITSDMKALHKNAIDALLEDTALTRPCQLIYSGSKFTSCPNCIEDVIGKKSANRYETGGPIPFPDGQICPYCQGRGRVVVEATETLYLMVIWDSKDFIGFRGAHMDDARDLNGMVQTLSSFATTYSKLKKANYIIFDTDISTQTKEKYTRASTPAPIGWGNDDFVITLWERTGAG